MPQVGNNENRPGGQYMVQDHDHMSEVSQPADQKNRKVPQVDQSHAETRQQGGDRSSVQRRQQD